MPDVTSQGSTHSHPASILKSPRRSESDVAKKQAAESRSGGLSGQIMQEVSRIQYLSDPVSRKSSSSSHHSKHSAHTSTMASPRRSNAEVAEKQSVESRSGTWPGHIMQEESGDTQYPSDPVSPKSSSSSQHSKHSRPTSTLTSPRRSKSDVAEKQLLESSSGTWPGQIMQEVSSDIQYPAVSPKVSSSSQDSKHSRPTSTLKSPSSSKSDVAEIQAVESSSGAWPAQIMQEVSSDIQYPSDSVSPKSSYSSHHSKHSRSSSTMVSPRRSKGDVAEKQSVHSSSGAWPDQILQEVSSDIQYPSDKVSPKSSSSSHRSKHSRPTSTLASPSRSKGDVAEKQTVDSSSGAWPDQIMQEVSSDIQYPTDSVSPKSSSSSHHSKHSRPSSTMASPRRSKGGVAEKESIESSTGAWPGRIMQDVSVDMQYPAVSPNVSSSAQASIRSRPTSKSSHRSNADVAEKQSVDSSSGAWPGQILQEVSSDIQYPAVSQKVSSSSQDSKHSRPTSTLKSPSSLVGDVAGKQAVEYSYGTWPAQIIQEVSRDTQYPGNPVSPKSSSSLHHSKHSRPSSTMASPRRSNADVAEKQSVDSSSGAWPGQIMQEVSNDIQYPGDEVSPKLSSLSNGSMRFGPTSTVKSPHRSKGNVVQKKSVESSAGAWPQQIMQEVSTDVQYPISPKIYSSSHTSVRSHPIPTQSSLCTATGDAGDVKQTTERRPETWPVEMTQEDSRGEPRSGDAKLSSSSQGSPYTRQTSLLSLPQMSSTDAQATIVVQERSHEDGNDDFVDDSKDATSELKMTESNCVRLERLSPRLASANSMKNSDEEKTHLSERERERSHNEDHREPMRSERLGPGTVESTSHASDSQDETPSVKEDGGSESQYEDESLPKPTFPMPGPNEQELPEEQRLLENSVDATHSINGQELPEEQRSITNVTPDFNEQERTALGDFDRPINHKTNSHDVIPDITEEERHVLGYEERSSAVNSNAESPYQQDSGESKYDSRRSSVNASDVTEGLKDRRRKASVSEKRMQSKRSSALQRRGTIELNEGGQLLGVTPDLPPSSPFFVRSHSSLKPAISGTGFRTPNVDSEEAIRERTEAPSSECIPAVETRTLVPLNAAEEVIVSGSTDRQDGGIAEGDSVDNDGVEPESPPLSVDGVEDVNREGSPIVVPTAAEYPEVPWVCVADYYIIIYVRT